MFHYYPMENRLMNVIEIINDLFTLFTSYCLFLFTDLIPNPEMRYQIGGYYKVILFIVITFDGLIIFTFLGYNTWR